MDAADAPPPLADAHGDTRAKKEKEPAPAVRTADIAACFGRPLEQHPELKSFLMDGEAASYEGVRVWYEVGDGAYMTIFEGAERTNKIERVPLYPLKTKKEMHALMVAKGLRLKPEEEVKEIQERHRHIHAREREERQKYLNERRGFFSWLRNAASRAERIRSSASFASAPYATIFLVLAVLAIVLRIRRNWQRQNKAHTT